MQFLNKLEKRLGKYAISGLMRYVIICYIIGYVIEYLMPKLYNYLTLEPYLIFHQGQIWRLVSWVLIPPPTSNIIFAVIMIILYYQLGTALERTWGTFRFNLFIFGGIIFTIIGALLLFVLVGVNMPVSFGSNFSMYYINMSIFLAFAVCYPNMQIMLYFIIPIKMKWMAIVYAALVAYEFFTSGWGGKVAIIASVLNFLIFFFCTRNYRSISPKEIHRKKSFKRQMQQPKGITKHKCAICGRTELDDPNLQFRFCSKCNGNYEYCQEHLFTHRHVE
jgi:hypothetical protein